MPSLGDVLVTARTLADPWLPTDAYYEDATYPDLAALLTQNPLGSVWDSVTSSFGADNILSMAVSDDGSVVVAAGGNNKIASSANLGASWTQRTSPMAAGTLIFGATYGGGQFLVGGTSGRLATSTDGISWTARSVSIGGNNVLCAGYGASLYVVGGNAGTLQTATNPTTWTARTSQFSTSDVNGVAYGGSLWVIVGDGGKVATSPDGLTWTLRTGAVGATNLKAVGYGNGLWVAAGQSGALMTSPDGINWTSRTSGIVGTLHAVRYVGGVWLVGASTGEVIYSTDGITWTAATAIASTIRAIVGYGTEAIAAGLSGNMVVSEGPPEGQFWVPPLEGAEFYNSYIYSGA